jgi:hypothetical protein
VYIQFLHPVREGPIRFVFRLLKEASRISVVQIELQTNSPKTDTFKTCVVAIIAQGNLSTESGLTIKTTPTLPRFLIPDREKDCEVYQLLPIAYEVAPVVMKFKSVRVKGAKDSMFNDRYGRTVKEIWVTRTDGAGWCVLSLGQLVDAVSSNPNILLTQHFRMVDDPSWIITNGGSSSTEPQEITAPTMRISSRVHGTQL